MTGLFIAKQYDKDQIAITIIIGIEIKWLIINKENVIVNKSEYNRLYPR